MAALRHPIKFREATDVDAAGVVFLLFVIGKPPRPRGLWMLRDIFLLARPPLLAVMQGGEYRTPASPLQSTVVFRNLYPEEFAMTHRSLLLNGRDITLPGGKQLFAGSSGGTGSLRNQVTAHFTFPVFGLPAARSHRSRRAAPAALAAACAESLPPTVLRPSEQFEARSRWPLEI